MIEISVKDTDIEYPLKTLTVMSDAEMSLSDKMAFIDSSVKEIKEDLTSMLLGTASVYDDYYDREADTDLEKAEIA